jgi:predicted RNase H-like nuclease (RuvC/YqgF family)
MDIELLAVGLSTVASLLGALTTYVAKRGVDRAAAKRAAEGAGSESFQERMGKLGEELKRASAQIDATLVEMRSITESRERSISTLEGRLQELASHEEALKKKVETLKQVPLHAVDYFLQATEKSEKRSARRDYLLFGSGVLVSTAITVVLKLVFGI